MPLGLIAGDEQDLTALLAHFEEARLNYDASYGEIHPNHGDLLVNRATVLAAASESERANRDCEAGMAILNDSREGNAAVTQQLQLYVTPSRHRRQQEAESLERYKRIIQNKLMLLQAGDLVTSACFCFIQCFVCRGYQLTECE